MRFSLNEELYINRTDFKGAIYDALEQVMEKYGKYGYNEKDLDKAYEWFVVHYFDYLK